MKPNPHLEKAIEWRDNPDAVTQEELEANSAAADAAWIAAADTDDAGPLGRVFYAAYAAQRGDAKDVSRWVELYYRAALAQKDNGWWAKLQNKPKTNDGIIFALLVIAACIEPRMLWVWLGLLLLGCAFFIGVVLVSLVVWIYKKIWSGC